MCQTPIMNSMKYNVTFSDKELSCVSDLSKFTLDF